MGSSAHKSGRKAARGSSRDLRAAPLGLRAVAFLIDWYLGSLVTALPVAVIATNLGLEMTDQDITSYAAPFGLIAGLLGIVAGLLYYAVVPMLMGGQTLGKRLLKLRIASKDGGSASPLQLLARQGLGLIVIEQAAVGTGTVVQQMISLTLGSTAANVVSWAGIALTLAGFALAVFHRDHRALHDFLAGTKLVKAE